MAEKASAYLEVQSGVNLKGEPFVQIIKGEHPIAQLSSAESRSFAMSVIEAAEAAEQDAFFRAFLRDKVGVNDEDRIGLVIVEFRKWREARGKSGPPSDPEKFVKEKAQFWTK